jgi:hypothetical protein
MSELAISHNPDQVGASMVILADVSGSMRGNKIIRLRQGLSDVWKSLKGARIIAFNDALWPVDGPTLIPEPSGGTNLTMALWRAGELFPSEVFLFSDGLPDDPSTALEEASRLPGVINVFFVGDDQDIEGIEFMRRLARVGGGQMVHRDLGKTLSIGAEIRELIALPGPTSMKGRS